MSAMQTAPDVVHTIAAGGADLEYVDTGAGEPVLLIHGGVFADWFGPVARATELSRFRVIRVRRAGYARGPAPVHHLSIEDHGRHCAALLDHLGLESVHVVGHSSGALVALALAAARPELVGDLVLVEPARAGDSWPATEAARQPLEPLTDAARSGNVRMAFDAFMSIVCAADYREVLDSSLGRTGLPDWERESTFFFTDEIAAVLEWPFDQVSASGVRTPTRVVVGGNSPPPVHQAVSQLAGWLPNASVEEIPESDHLVPLRHPARLAATIAHFAGRD